MVLGRICHPWWKHDLGASASRECRFAQTSRISHASDQIEKDLKELNGCFFREAFYSPKDTKCQVQTPMPIPCPNQRYAHEWETSAMP